MDEVIPWTAIVPAMVQDGAVIAPPPPSFATMSGTASTLLINGAPFSSRVVSLINLSWSNGSQVAGFNGSQTPGLHVVDGVLVSTPRHAVSSPVPTWTSKA